MRRFEAKLRWIPRKEPLLRSSATIGKQSDDAPSEDLSSLATGLRIDQQRNALGEGTEAGTVFLIPNQRQERENTLSSMKGEGAAVSASSQAQTWSMLEALARNL